MKSAHLTKLEYCRFSSPSNVDRRGPNIVRQAGITRALTVHEQVSWCSKRLGTSNECYQTGTLYPEQISTDKVNVQGHRRNVIRGRSAKVFSCSRSPHSADDRARLSSAVEPKLDTNRSLKN